MPGESRWPPARLLVGRVAVVTGGAGGIGGALCRLLAEQGADVVIADWDRPRLQATTRAVRALGRRALPIAGDLTRKSTVARLQRRTLEVFGRVDILVNGLGEHLRSAGPFESSTEDQWQALYEVNLLHVFRASQAFIPGMQARGWGRILNFSSVEGIRSAPHLAVYAAFKAAVDGFTKSLGVDLARSGILVNALAVDKTRTYQVSHYALPEEYERLIPTWVPAGHFAEPEEVARIGLFLVSDLNTWITGQTIAADGGTLAAGGWYRTPARWTNTPLMAQYLEDPSLNAQRPPSVQ